MRANCAGGAVRDAQPTTLPSIPALPLAADFFHQLARADLTATGYQVLCWHLERLIRHRMTSEAVPLDTVAQALGLHRNAVGKAYAALTAAGLIRRQEVRQRGAPTRTCLEGVALHVVLQSMGQRARPAAVTSGRHTAVPVGTASVSHGKPGSPRGADAALKCDNAPLPPESRDGVGAAAPPAAVATAYPAELQAKALAKLPPMACYDALQGTLTAASIDPTWNLTEAERAFVLGMTQRKSATPKPAACMKPVPTQAPKAIAAALQQHREQFAQLVDVGALSQLGQAEQEAMAETATLVDGLLDQVAYMIAKRGLGRGDVHAGVRAARSLVAQGRWTLPWDFTRDWYGAVQRGAAEHLA